MSSMRCLVIMPFKAEFDPVYRVVQATVSTAVPGEQIDCYWLKDVYSAGRITDDILEGIQKSALCVSDVSAANPNVMWETGYAMALRKPTVLISQDVETLPFDLKVHRVLPYRLDAVDNLAPTLAEAVRQTLARYNLNAVGPVASAAHGSASVIAVTGSSSADPARLRRRVETLLRPYFPMRPLWYCGSNGAADEAVLSYLLANDQSAVAVGFHRFDFSAGVRELVQRGAISFIDASVEAIPRGLDGPTDRDVFFASKADLVVLLWDGKSTGTAGLLEFFRHNMTNTLVGFV